MNTTSHPKSGNSLRIALAALALGLTASANAGDFVNRDIAVSYEVSSVATEHGAMELLQRIAWAAQDICAPLDHGTLVSRAKAKSCRQEVMAATVSKVNHPMVQAAYDLDKGVKMPLAKLDR